MITVAITIWLWVSGVFLFLLSVMDDGDTFPSLIRMPRVAIAAVLWPLVVPIGIIGTIYDRRNL